MAGLYLCDPLANWKCTKTSCWYNTDSAFRTCFLCRDKTKALLSADCRPVEVACAISYKSPIHAARVIARGDTENAQFMIDSVQKRVRAYGLRKKIRTEGGPRNAG